MGDYSELQVKSMSLQLFVDALRGDRDELTREERIGLAEHIEWMLDKAEQWADQNARLLEQNKEFILKNAELAEMIADSHMDKKEEE